MVARRDVEAPVTPLHRCPETVFVFNGSFDSFDVCTSETPPIGPGAQEGHDLMPARQKLMHEVRSDESRGSCDKTTHARSLDCEG
jgi:hypothetical protein